MDAMTKFRLIMLVALMPLMAGCGGLADDLGLGRNSPDEFAVVDRPPLAMPPDFTLRPPQPGASRPQESKMSDRAATVLFGAGNDQPVTTASGSEGALLELAGANRAQSDIRKTVDRESAERVTASKRLIDDLLWWRENRAPTATVNAPEEAKRLRDAKVKGDNAAKGATPVIERGRPGWLGL